MAVAVCGGCPSEVRANPSEPCRNRRVSYRGAVLGLRERNEGGDSDFVAVVWDEHGQCVREVVYATTRGWCYHDGAVVDATPDVRARALEWWRAKLRESEVERRKRVAREIGVGVMVRSTTTRGKNVGVVGEVLLIAPNRFDKKKYRVKVSVTGEPQPRWLDRDRVEVANPPSPKLNKKTRRRIERATPGDWGTALVNLSRGVR